MSDSKKVEVENDTGTLGISPNSSSGEQPSTAPEEEEACSTSSSKAVANNEIDTNAQDAVFLKEYLDGILNGEHASDASPPVCLQNTCKLLSKLLQDKVEDRVVKLQVVKRIVHDCSNCLEIFRLVGFQEEEGVRLRFANEPITILGDEKMYTPLNMKIAVDRVAEHVDEMQGQNLSFAEVATMIQNDIKLPGSLSNLTKDY